MSVLFEKTPYLTEKPFHYCPGCNHGIIHRLVAECLEESGMGEKIAGIAPVGCSVFAYDYFNCDMLEAAHGRAPAVATGVKRAKPDTLRLRVGCKLRRLRLCRVKGEAVTER